MANINVFYHFTGKNILSKYRPESKTHCKYNFNLTISPTITCQGQN